MHWERAPSAQATLLCLKEEGDECGHAAGRWMRPSVSTGSSLTDDNNDMLKVTHGINGLGSHPCKQFGCHPVRLVKSQARFK